MKLSNTERKEREQKLNSTKEKLKKEFIGLDKIIDQVINSITVWYLTPEIISRPVVVSLWGMTGTGKSSLVNKLIELLDLNNKSIKFDCGECREDTDIPNKISTFLDSEDGIVSEGVSDGLILTFDEFQYARTIDEAGIEDIKPSLRPIWSLMDDGKIDTSSEYFWGLSNFSNYYNKLILLVNRGSDIKIVNGKIPSIEDKKILLDCMESYFDNSPEPDKESDLNKEFDILPKRVKEFLNNRSMLFSEGIENFKTVREFSGNLSEFCDYLKKIKKVIYDKRYIDCSNSLVFVIGNLDEAYNISGELSPDMSADVYYEITSSVTLSDIKEALKKRFRAEQVARLGNNLILYPTLNKKSIKKIIEKELYRISEEFKKNVLNIDIKFSESLINLLYSEGTYPTQGVRPVFTTINTMISPCLSRILVNKNENIKEVLISTDSTNFKQDSINIIIEGLDEKIKINQPLQLGSLRNPANRKKRFISSVHEIGHAIVFAMRTGNIPDNIVSVSTDGGGFCSVHEKEKLGEIDSRRDIDNNIIISLGGYEAEEIIYGDRPDMCLMGSSCDLNDAWNSFSVAVCECGYFRPVNFSLRDINMGNYPTGIEPTEDVLYYNGTKFTNYSLPLKEAISERFKDLKLDAHLILEKEVVLIKEASKILGEVGSINSDTFKDLINKFGNEISLEKLKEIKLKYGNDFYKNVLDGRE